MIGRIAGPSWPVISGGPSLLGLNMPAPEMGSGEAEGGVIGRRMAGTMRCGRLPVWTIFSMMSKNRGGVGAR